MSLENLCWRAIAKKRVKHDIYRSLLSKFHGHNKTYKDLLLIFSTSPGYER